MCLLWWCLCILSHRAGQLWTAAVTSSLLIFAICRIYIQAYLYHCTILQIWTECKRTWININLKYSVDNYSDSQLERTARKQYEKKNNAHTRHKQLNWFLSQQKEERNDLRPTNSRTVARRSGYVKSNFLDSTSPLRVIALGLHVNRHLHLHRDLSTIFLHLRCNVFDLPGGQARPVGRATPPPRPAHHVFTLRNVCRTGSRAPPP